MLFCEEFTFIFNGGSIFQKFLSVLLFLDMRNEVQQNKIPKWIHVSTAATFTNFLSILIFFPQNPTTAWRYTKISLGNPASSLLYIWIERKILILPKDSLCINLDFQIQLVHVCRP